MAEAPRLKPQTVTEILDSSFRLYRENFAQFLGILAIVYIPGIILQMLLTARVSVPVASGKVRPVMSRITRVCPMPTMVSFCMTAGSTCPSAV